MVKAFPSVVLSLFCCFEVRQNSLEEARVAFVEWWKSDSTGRLGYHFYSNISRPPNLRVLIEFDNSLPYFARITPADPQKLSTLTGSNGNRLQQAEAPNRAFKSALFNLVIY